MNRTVNCLIVDDEPIACEILEEYLSKVNQAHLVATCNNPLEAIEILNTQTIDLLFLDIQMPELSGISLAQILGNRTQIIFTTAYRDYAVDGFNLKAVDYLLKPISFERFMQAFNIYLERTEISDNNTEGDYFFVRSERKMVKVVYDDILYIESLSDYLRIVTKDKEVITRETISRLEENLPQNFIRIHRSYIIPVSKIESFNHEWVEINGKELPVSRNYREQVLNILNLGILK